MNVISDCSTQNPAIASLEPEAFRSLVEAGQAGVVLDVRTEIEHKACCLAAPHINIPLDRFSAVDFVAEKGADTPVYILCAAGRRAMSAAESLVSAGHRRVSVVVGGLNACEGGGLSILRNSSVVGLDRQVRIAAGALVLLGVVLGSMVSPAFYLLSAAIGGGLVFSGVTDRCGLAMILAKAPWNCADSAPVVPSCCGGGAHGSKPH